MLFQILQDMFGWECAVKIKQALILLGGFTVGSFLTAIFYSHAYTKIKTTEKVDGAALVQVEKDGHTYFYTGESSRKNVRSALYAVFMYFAWRIRGARSRVVAADSRLASLLIFSVVCVAAILLVLNIGLILDTRYP